MPQAASVFGPNILGGLRSSTVVAAYRNGKRPFDNLLEGLAQEYDNLQVQCDLLFQQNEELHEALGTTPPTRASRKQQLHEVLGATSSSNDAACSDQQTRVSAPYTVSRPDTKEHHPSSAIRFSEQTSLKMEEADQMEEKDRNGLRTTDTDVRGGDPIANAISLVSADTFASKSSDSSPSGLQFKNNVATNEMDQPARFANQNLSNPCKPARREDRILTPLPKGTKSGSKLQTQSSGGIAHAIVSGVRTRQRWKRARHSVQGGERLCNCAFVKGTQFSALSAFCIVCNSAYTGFLTNQKLQAELDRLKGHKYESFDNYKYGDLIFCSFFSIELILRLFADRWVFFVGRENSWNIFDLVVVLTSVCDLITQFFNLQIKIGMSFLRTLRILRIIRVLRVARQSRIIQNLKTMLYSIAGSSTSFMSALILLFTIIYIFGLVFMSGMLAHLKDLDLSDANNSDEHMFISSISRYYGTIEVTLWTLFAAVTGGHDWVEVADIVVKLGPIYTLAFLLYVSFVLLGLLNILNGVFVNAALQSSAMNRELAVDAAMKKRQHMISEMVHLFLDAGEEDRRSQFSGSDESLGESEETFTVSWDRFEEYMCDEGIKAYFMALDLDMASLGKIFRLLDSERTGKLDLEVFVDGCMRLRGSAKMVDISILESLNEDMARRIATLGAQVLHRFDLMHDPQQTTAFLREQASPSIHEVNTNANRNAIEEVHTSAVLTEL